MVIGVTGNFGVGKSTVADMFRRLGAKVIDADRIAHRLIRGKGELYKQLVASFGRGILSDRNQNISRRKLAEVVFGNRQALAKLNALMHPKILEIIKDRIRNFPADEILIVDAALLIETGDSFSCGTLAGKSQKKKRPLSWSDKAVVVKSSLKTQMQRLKRNGFSDEEIKKRLSAQLPQKEKVGFADFVIDNSGTRSKTRKQVSRIWDKIINSYIASSTK